MPKNTAMWISVVALVLAVVAILAVAKVITLPWSWG